MFRFFAIAVKSHHIVAGVAIDREQVLKREVLENFTFVARM